MYSEAAQCAWNPYMYWVATYYLFSVNEFIFTQSAAGRPSKHMRAWREPLDFRHAFTLQSVGDLTPHL